jgi:hypothetical protein
VEEFKSTEIALEQIETALRLFKETQEYFSIITLAGAADEILGKACREQGIRNSLEQLQHSSYLMYQILFGDTDDKSKKKTEKWVADRENFARNKSKHINPIKEPVLTIDARKEARDLINRALDNWWALGMPYSPAMLEFHNNENYV